MEPSSRYAVRVETAEPRAMAAVHARMPMPDVPRRFAHYLDQVYAAARAGAVQVDGQNIFVYRNADASCAPGEGAADVEFGVGARAAFAPVGEVRHVMLPAGEVAATTHWGDYATLGQAHAAVIAWCASRGRRIAGPRWEVYGHWSDDPAQRRTDVYYLLVPDERTPARDDDPSTRT